jgi:anti-sigma regulatory factor (Ser/Thr protein kinase)
MRGSDDRDPDVRYEFKHEPNAPRRARQALHALFPDPNDPIADSVELAASELVSNVVQHTTDGGRVSAWDPRPDIPLRLEVEDYHRTHPVVRDVPDESGGRGLAIVDNVADAWGVDATEEGKVVWAEFNRPRDQDETPEP